MKKGKSRKIYLLMSVLAVCVCILGTNTAEATPIDGVKTVNGVKIEAIDKATPLDGFVDEDESINVDKANSKSVDPSITTPFLTKNQTRNKYGVRVICYHDVVANSQSNIGTYEIKQKTLDEHFAYFKRNRYKVISLDEYIQIAEGKKRAERNSVLLVFDDGDQSLYNYVYPLLKKYNYNAVSAVITSKVGKTENGKTFVTWPQLKEMENSKLLDVASHSDDQHYWDTVDPYGNYLQSISHVLWTSSGYESDSDYKGRIQRDLEYSQELLKRNLGHTSRTVVWPYGEYNKVTMSIAKKAGFDIYMTLIDGMNYENTAQAKQYVRRQMFTSDDNIREFLRDFEDYGGEDKTKTAQVSIDDVYVKGNIDRTTQNVTKLINNLERNDIDSVFLETYSDPNKDGSIKGVYFNTDKAPVIDNVYNHIAIRLDEADFTVYAAMPSIGSQWLINQNNAVKSSTTQDKTWYKRVSPFSESAVKNLEELYWDFAKASRVDGILFGDDLYLGEHEDFSSDAQKAYQKKFGRALDNNIYRDRRKVAEWEKWKTDSLMDLTDRLMNETQVFKPTAISIRDLYADSVLNCNSNKYAQSFTAALNRYNALSVMEYTYVKQGGKYQWCRAASDKRFLRCVVQSAGRRGYKVITKMQTNHNWMDYNIYSDISSINREARYYRINHLAYCSNK